MPSADSTPRAGYLSISALTKQYKNTSIPAVDRVSLNVDEGDFLALLGPSGCGKTTTLRMIAGLIEPSSGSVSVQGKDITKSPVHKRSIGMVFQNYALFPHLDVKSNVAYGLKMRRVPKAEIAVQVQNALDLVRLGHLADRRVTALSGGQQQRVALARAIVVNPQLFLMDEPLSNLDAKLRDAMRTEIRSIQRKMGITSVFVTHDQDEALTMADKIAVMSEGVLEQFGTPSDIFERPATRFVAEFVGQANLLDDIKVSGSAGNHVLDVPGAGHLSVPRISGTYSGKSTAMVRPHQLKAHSFSSSSNGIRGDVRSATYFGDTIQYEIQAGQNLLRVQMRADGSPTLAVGSEAAITAATDTIHFIAA
ncbi:ABC transporter ATP-binding protein [Arthrobacter sp. StoSoilB5]|uniref:ABC transporter ATP-binding protein n=1 Tax=Arthrobacter sp. StoSoilB5 TaxID=2830992 RepID=UPI001CC580D9|nr:ABC transporter ATP-binding protein [Arthrobacter sp. StoSoilB5]BCW44891.1 ABC transporter ATP-binding protein [Arthrobacter sp. StoSoilB5]